MNKEQTEKYISRLMAYSGVVDLNKALPLQLDYLFQKLEPNESVEAAAFSHFAVDGVKDSALGMNPVSLILFTKTRMLVGHSYKVLFKKIEKFESYEYKRLQPEPEKKQGSAFKTEPRKSVVLTLDGSKKLEFWIDDHATIDAQIMFFKVADLICTYTIENLKNAPSELIEQMKSTHEGLQKTIAKKNEDNCKWAVAAYGSELSIEALEFAKNHTYAEIIEKYPELEEKTANFFPKI